MAYSYSRVGSSGKTFKEFNLDFSVGHNGVELPDDIMLAQMLLRIVYFENKIAELPRLPGDDEIQVTGKSNDTLMYRYILHFKSQVIKQGVKLHPDEIFDPMRDNDPDKKSTRSKTIYAFSRLQNVCQKKAPARFGSFATDPKTPDRLQSALRQTRKTARQYNFVD